MKRIYIISLRKTYIYCTILAFLIIIGLVLFSKLFIADSLKASAGDGAVLQTGNGGKLAIIIDDFGQNRSGVKEMMSIDRHMTFAVMPFLQFSKDDAQMAHEKGFEVIAHLPLESNGGRLSWVGPKPILSSMLDEEITKITKNALDDIPFAAGANIHMGSKAGSDVHVINAILSLIKERNLYFVDSRSCNHPIAKGIADKMGVACLERNIFIDGKKPKSLILDNLAKAQEMALKKGKAIVIGHVGTEGGVITAEAIREMLPEFDKNNVSLVYVSELLDRNQ